MNKLKSGLAVASAVALTLTLNTVVGTKVNIVKADADIQSQQGVVLRSTNFATKKVLKVPVKPKSTSSSNSSKRGSLSRGGNANSSSSSYYSAPASYTGASSVVSYAYNFLGRPYVYGASGPRAFDCSGFTAYVYSAFGVYLPHFTVSQSQMGSAVSRGNLSPGDLVFFNTAGYISHVGIYIGGGQFIHASSGSGRITISSLSDSYYAARYVCARRVK